MKDIDFDELDRAVNSLMASVVEPNDSALVAPGTPAATPVPSADNSGSAPAERVPAPAAVPTEAALTPVAVRSLPPAARRSGRFMDMVHTPSAAMKPRSEAPAPVVVPSREGILVTPRSGEENSAPAVSTSTVPTQASKVDNLQMMPDPLDMMTPAPTEAVEPEPTDQSPVTASNEPSVTPVGSQESPFLSDAKVEKRPLNAAGGNDSEPDASFEGIDLGVQDEQASSPTLLDDNDADEPPINPQVPELNSDLVAIESDEVIDSVQAIDTAEAARQVSPPGVPLGPASIAQQYTQQPSTGDQSHAAIYDASQYPEPLGHPAKSKSGWMWVVWVALLLGLGAGGAVVLYNLGIIP